jgi:hypothetical protein
LHPASAGVTFVLDNGTTVAAPTEYVAAPTDTQPVLETLDAIHRDVQVNLHKYQKLSNYECYSNYSNPYVYRPTVLLVSKDYELALELNSSVLGSGTPTPSGLSAGNINPYWWDKGDWVNFLEPRSTMTLNESVMDGWKSVGYRIQHCLQVADASAASAFSACRVQCAPSVLLGRRI